MQASQAASDEKVLRFCLARVRAWSTEFCLYSTDPNAGLSTKDLMEWPKEATTVNDAPCEATLTEPERAIWTAPTFIEPAIRENLWAFQRIEEPNMTPQEMQMHAMGRWPSFDSLLEGSEPVDTDSVLESADAPPQVTSDLQPTTTTAGESAMAIPARLLADEAMVSVAVQEPVVASARRQAVFRPLPTFVAATPALRPKCKVPRLRTPRVVSQILKELPAPWATLAKEIETRVTRDGMRTLMVATSLVGEGSTSVSCALACALAEHTSLRLLLVDADFCRPSLAKVLQLPSRVGVEHHLLERVSLDEIIVSCDKPKLDILPILEPFEVTACKNRRNDLMTRMRSAYDLVVLDVGAVLESSEPTDLPAGIDATLVVRDPAKSSPALLDRLDAHLAEHGVSSLGVIENGVET